MNRRSARAEDRPVAEVVAELRRRLAPLAPRGDGTRDYLPTGIALVDEVLGGGLPRGQLVELTGSAGRLTVALSAIAEAGRQGLLAGLIDGANAVEPRSAEQLGVDLTRVLWAA